MSEPSHVPLSPGQPNPYYHKAEWLLRESPLLAMQEAIRKECMLNPHKSFAEIRAWAAEKFFSQFSDAVKQFDTVKAPTQHIGPPPASRELYGRIADAAAVVDIGSGNCMKLRSSAGRLRVTAVDPAIPDDPALQAMTIRKVREEIDLDKIPSGSVLTSFNALVQLEPDTARQVLERDGIHVVPDHEWLIKNNICEEVDGKVVVHTGNGVYRDYPISHAGYSLKEGYKLILGLDSATASIETFLSASGSGWKEGAALPRSEAAPANEINFDWGDIGYKWDGTFYVLQLSGKRARIIDRAGRWVDATSDRDLGEGYLHIEKLVTSKSQAWVLLRVAYWHNMLPPHSGDVLRYFCERVRLRIDGIPLYGPPKFDPCGAPVLGGHQFPVDGLISRSGERDYYTKKTWTVDLYPDGVTALTAAMAKQGLMVTGDKNRGLWEYEVRRKGEVVRLRATRSRTDKTVATKLATCEYLMGLPTLFELAALYGDKSVEGLRPFLV